MSRVAALLVMLLCALPGYAQSPVGASGGAPIEGSAVSSSGAVTTVLSLQDGTAAAPALVFASDPDTGIYKYGANYLGFATSGSIAMALSTAKLLMYKAIDLGSSKGYSSTGILQLGMEITSSHSLGTGAVGVGGNLEVDGTLYADDAVNINGYGAFIAYIDDGLHLGLSPTEGQAQQNLIITALANYAQDHDHDTASTNPTVFVHSATSPNTDNTQWVSLAHNQTNAVIGSGKGPVGIVSAGLMPAKVVADPCAGATYAEGAIFYNDTSNYFCYCDGTNDVQMHNPAAACF